ncbi:hypothetical protein BU26DRAFT_210467 [Trematosphaeria pertusa]|uniref:Uncharacterized protein n=1 Tax=Trematosphaeria pertusa TaxID=390896 RepID=A0A6A6IR35_9PLEO|nr:uncharacterized protein BU26DRAFT_210467 [Trematosphaeria pertusa]KAF2252836.1 hypothetical protein BU26DRAFT_210467 [Trematosphaeria pertusa]
MQQRNSSGWTSSSALVSYSNMEVSPASLPWSCTPSNAPHVGTTLWHARAFRPPLSCSLEANGRRSRNSQASITNLKLTSGHPGSIVRPWCGYDLSANQKSICSRPALFRSLCGDDVRVPGRAILMPPCSPGWHQR